MKAPKSVALGLAAALAASGAVGLATTGAAQAATQSFQLYSQVNPGLQPNPDDKGAQTVTLTVTPASALPGAPIEVEVGSPTMALANGPASVASANATELAAVVAINGTDYVLRGSQATQDIAVNDPENNPTATTPTIFKAGWTISSNPGESSSFSDNGTGNNVAGTGGLGTAVRGAEATIVPLTAPATVGTYPLTLKAIVMNSIAGSGTPALNNGFDAIINTKNCTVCTGGAGAGTNDGPKNSFNNNVESSYITFSPAVSVRVAEAATASITAVTDPDTPSGSVPTGTPQYLREGNTFTISSGANQGWAPDTRVQATVCTDAAGTACAPPFAAASLWAGSSPAYSATNPMANADGALPPTTLVAAGFSTYSGLAYIALFQGATASAATAKVVLPVFLVTEDRSVTTAASAFTGNPANVTAANFYPGETVTLDDNGSTEAKTVVADSTGAVSTTYTFTDTAATKLTATGIGGSADATVTVTTDTTAPTGTGSLTATTGWPGVSTTLNISDVVEAQGAGTVVPTITWGDSSAPEVLAAGATSASHSYAAAGTYDVTFTLKDPANNTSTAITAGTVTVTTPAGDFTRTPSILWATQAAKITPSGIGADVETVSVNWGDGTSTGSISKTRATSHVYKSTGWKTITVTFKKSGNTYSKAIGRVAVYKDTYKPVVGLANPKNATKGSSWTTIKGTVIDKGLGPKSVTVQAVQKRGSKYYALTNSGWKKASSKTAALRAAKKITDTTVSTKFWAVKIRKPAKGSLYVYFSAVDRANNKSAVKIKSQTIKS